MKAKDSDSIFGGLVSCWNDLLMYTIKMNHIQKCFNSKVNSREDQWIESEFSSVKEIKIFWLFNKVFTDFPSRNYFYLDTSGFHRTMRLFWENGNNGLLDLIILIFSTKNMPHLQEALADYILDVSVILWRITGMVPKMEQNAAVAEQRIQDVAKFLIKLIKVSHLADFMLKYYIFLYVLASCY